MGQITSALAKPFRNFNVVHRATKVLERRQKVGEAPPLHPSTVEKFSRFRDEHAEFLESQKNRDEKLHEHLKNIHVESTQAVKSLTSTRAFPMSRTALPETDMGALESQANVPGRVSLKTVLSFLNQHRSDPREFTASKIAKENGLEEKDVENILHYIQILYLFIPKEMYDHNKKLHKLVAQQMKELDGNTSFILPKKIEDKDKTESDFSPTKI